MEPEDNRRFSNSPNMHSINSRTSNSDNFRSVQQIQTSKSRRRKGMGSEMAAEEHHDCSATTCSRSTALVSSPLVLFLLTSALLLLTCVSPSHSLPFEGRSLSSSSGGGGRSQRSQMDLLIDPIHQAEYGDDDPLENTRVVKSVFDMVLRTPPPPTSSASRCPPGTQSPYEGAPCYKKSTDPVAFVDQSLLLDTLRGLAQKGELLGGRKKRPGSGSNRRRPSGRPGQRTSTTTQAPATSLSSEEEEAGDMSTTTAATLGSSNPTGDNANVNVAVEEEVLATITQEPSTSPPLETTLASAPAEGDDAETVAPTEEAVASSSADQNSAVDSTMAPPQQAPDAPVTTATEVVAVITEPTTTTSTTTTSTTTTEAPETKNGAYLRRTVAPEKELSSLAMSSPPAPAASLSPESSTGNEEQLIGVTTASAPTEPTGNIPSEEVKDAVVAEQVKSGQVHEEENEKGVQVPRAPVTTTVLLTKVASQSSSANNSSQDNDTNSQGEGQFSPETLPEKQETSQSTETFVTTASTQPTFPQGDHVLALTSSVDLEDKQEQALDNVAISRNSTPSASPAPSAQPYEPVMMPLVTITKNPSPNGAGVTGDMPAEDLSRHHNQEVEQIPPQVSSPSERTEMGSLPESKPSSSEIGEDLEERVDDLMKPMMAVRMLKAATDDRKLEDEPMDKEEPVRSDMPIVVVEDFSEMQPPSSASESKESPAAVLQYTEREPASLPSGAPMVAEREEEESKEVTDSRQITASEQVDASGLTEVVHTVVKVPTSPLGPLEQNTSEPALVQDEEQVGVQEVPSAGDMSMTRGQSAHEEGKHQQNKTKGTIEAGPEQGDDQPSSNYAPLVAINHSTDGEQGKETVPLHLEDVDLPISSTNLPASVSPIHTHQLPQDDESSQGINDGDADKGVPSPVPVIMENSGGDGVVPGHKYEEIHLSSRENGAVEDVMVEKQAAQQLSSTVVPLILAGKDEPNVPGLETTLVPPPLAPKTTALPGNHPLHRFPSGDTLLQFQLPIVTRVPSSEAPQHGHENEAVTSFQTFPPFPTDSGKVRFPDSTEQDDGNGSPARSRGTFKPIFVQDFHLDYPQRREEAPTPRQSPLEQQQWQVPQPFQPPQTSQEAERSAAAALPEYYDTGSTEYLESELDRRHQKTRSRNRLSTTQTLAVPSSTGQPVLPPELSFYSPPPQQHPSPVPLEDEDPPTQHHHSQQPLFFARRNPSADLIPFGYLNFRTGHDRFHHNTRRLIW